LSSKRAVLAAGLGIGIAGVGAHAFEIGDVAIQGDEQLVVQRGDESFIDNGAVVERDKEVLESRLRLEMRWRSWVLGGRFDYLDPFFFDDVEYTGLRKAFLEYEDGENHLRIGSFAALFGRGLALNLFEDPTINADRELLGVLAERRTTNYSLSALWGLGAYEYFDEPDPYEKDRVGAAYGTYRFLPQLELGQGYVETRDVEPNVDDFINRKHLSTLRIDLDQGALYGEVVQNFVTRPDGSTPGHGPGYGAYFELSTWAGPFTLRGSYKNYNMREEAHTSLGVPWSEPPSLRPVNDLTTLNRKQFSINKSNEVGFSLDASYDADFGGSFDIFYVKTGDRHYFDLAAGEEKTLWLPTWEGFAGVSGSLTNLFEEVTFKGDLPLRDEWSSHFVADFSVDGHLGARKTQHTLGWTNELELGSTQGLVISLEYQRTDDTKFSTNYELDFPGDDPPVFHDGIATITYSRSPWLAAFVTYERTNEAKHWKEIGYKQATEALRDSYLLGGLNLDLTPQTRLGLQFGRERGGVVCRGGTCKFIQPFKGWRMELVQRF
jgi:hypothetical protein